MLASPRSLERMIENRLRRWGLKPLRRSGQVFICIPSRLKLNLGEFFSILEYDNELKIANPEEPIMSILENRVKRDTDAAAPWKNYVSDQKNAARYKKDQASEELSEVLADVTKVRVQVK